MRKELFDGTKNVIVQGITGTHGTFHMAAMLAAGTNVVAGTSPNKAGEEIHGVPVYATIADIQSDLQVDASVIFVPAPFAKAAMSEALDARIPLIVCITEGVPIHDMLAIKQQAVKAGVVLVGPNCPGILMPNHLKLGIIPASMGTPGHVGIVSRSGTLTYEAAASLTARGIGQKYIIGIGGDRIRGTDFIDCLELFENDPDIASIVLIGEIGGTGEQAAAEYIKKHVTKPVYAYIAGHAAPPGVQLGHAGAILGSTDESAVAKTEALQNAGVTTAGSITKLASVVK
jgi:succinyl-CoA synthetase alpha subunit